MYSPFLLVFIFPRESELCLKKDHLTYFDRELVLCACQCVDVCV